MEGFFQTCISFDSEVAVKELILRRYHNPEYIFSMDISEFLEFFAIAKEKEREEMARAQWVPHLPWMSLGMMKYVSFKDYYDKLSGKNIDLRPTDEIIAEIEKLHEKRGD